MTGERWVKCPHCEQLFKWSHLTKTPREPVVDPSLSLEERRRMYAKRHRDKKNNTQ